MRIDVRVKARRRPVLCLHLQHLWHRLWRIPVDFPGNLATLLTNLGRGTVEVAGCLAQAASMPQDVLPLSFPLHIESMPSAMADQPRLEIIKDNPIGNGLDAFRASFNKVYTDRTIWRIPDALGQLDQECMTVQLR